jgi:hypothetical protein
MNVCYDKLPEDLGVRDLAGCGSGSGPERLCRNQKKSKESLQNEKLTCIHPIVIENIGHIHNTSFS